MKCTKGHSIKLVEQVAQWDRDYGDEVSMEPGFPAMLMIDCGECERQVAMLEIIPLGESDFVEVETPEGMKVQVPSPSPIPPPPPPEKA